MTTDLRGRTVLVTGVGGAGQVGFAVARGCAAAGAALVVVDRNADLVAARREELERGGARVRHAAADLTDPAAARAAVDAAVREFGGLDALINVAGGLVSAGPVEDVTPERFERELAINLRTAFFMSQAAIPALAARGGGAIVNFSSIAVERPLANLAVYSAAKWAVAGLTRALARDLRSRGIRVNAVAPATLRTAANVAEMGAGAAFVELDDLVQVVLFLAGDGSRGLTGAIVPVPGRGA